MADGPRLCKRPGAAFFSESPRPRDAAAKALNQRNFGAFSRRLLTWPSGASAFTSSGYSPLK